MYICTSHLVQISENLWSSVMLKIEDWKGLFIFGALNSYWIHFSTKLFRVKLCSTSETIDRYGIAHPQCKNSRIFLLLTFYVKHITVSSEQLHDFIKMKHFQDFSTAQILRENDFEDFRSSQTAIFYFQSLWIKCNSWRNFYKNFVK